MAPDVGRLSNYRRSGIPARRGHGTHGTGRKAAGEEMGGRGGERKKDKRGTRSWASRRAESGVAPTARLSAVARSLPLSLHLQPFRGDAALRHSSPRLRRRSWSHTSASGLPPAVTRYPIRCSPRGAPEIPVLFCFCSGNAAAEADVLNVRS